MRIAISVIEFSLTTSKYNFKEIILDLICIIFNIFKGKTVFTRRKRKG